MRPEELDNVAVDRRAEIPDEVPRNPPMLPNRRACWPLGATVEGGLTDERVPI